MKAREVQDVERAKDQEAPAARELEAKLRDLMDGERSTAPRDRRAARDGSNSTSRRRKVSDGQPGAAIKEAVEIGLLPTLIEQAQEKLRGAEMWREEARQRKAAEARGQRAALVRGPERRWRKWNASSRKGRQAMSPAVESARGVACVAGRGLAGRGACGDPCHV